MKPLLLMIALAAPAVAQPASRAAQPAVIQPFTVEVTLSAAATARMATIREAITVGAGFYGEPTADARRLADRTGQLGLGREEVTIPGRTGSATIVGRTLDEARLKLVKDRNVQVLINVYSARRTTQNNLLDCGIFQDSVAVAVRSPVRIACKLIGEG